MSAVDETGTLISNSIGELGFYQILVTVLLSLCRVSEVQYQLLVLIISPPLKNFTCTNSSLTECDKNCPSHSFDHSIWEKTIIHEWDLVCDKKYIPSGIQSIIMFGVLSGNLIIGYFADRFGRSPSLLFCILLEICAGITTAFVPWLWLHIMLRFLTLFSIGGTIITSFSIVVEMIGSKHRGFVAVMFSIPCCLGQAILAPIGYFSSRRWDHIQLIVSLPTIVFLSYYFIHESPRWLITTGKKEFAIKTLEAIAKCNKLPLDQIRPQVEEFLNQEPELVQKKGGNIIDLFRTKKMSVKTIVLCFNWMIVSMSFFGMAQHIGEISGDIFINIGLSGLILIPGTLIASYLITKIGRKWCLILFYIICSLSMFTVGFLPEEPAWPIQILAFTSVSAIVNNYAVLYPYSSELYPTIVRAVGIGLSSMCACFGAMISPFILDLKQVNTYIPPLVFSALSVIGAASTAIFLPKTKGKPFPDTLEDAEQI